MQINLQPVKVLCGERDKIQIPKSRPIFDELVVDFLDQVSKVLLKHPEGRNFPDVITFGFFVRKGNLLQMERPYLTQKTSRMGRGLTFHVAPSNVPVNFAYSLVMGLLAGNSCIVKASSKNFPQTRMIVDAIRQVEEKKEFREMIPYITVVEYPRDFQEGTQYYSAMANARIIWGGDETIERVRQAPLPPRSIEVSFADRYSLAVIRASAILQEQDMEKLASAFYNDTYLFDQNACTAPRLLYWMGNQSQVTQAQEVFWKAVSEVAEKRYLLEPVIAMDKYTTLCRALIELPGAQRIPNDQGDNRVVRVSLQELSPKIQNLTCPGGFFFEYQNESLDPLGAVINEKYQTLSYFGMDREEIRNWVMNQGIRGIDRIVPMGSTMNFDPIWDGQDLILTLSRCISISS